MKRLLSLSAFILIMVLTLPTWQDVGAAEQKGYETFSLGELYVTGERLPAAMQVTQVTEITAEQIEATNSKSVAEALTYVPGLTVTTGRKNSPSVNIRGLNLSKTLVMIDGVPYYESSFGSLDLNGIPTDNIAKIEIQKGVSSVLYGPNAMAGVINIVTKKAGVKPALGALVEIGDYEARRLAVWNGMKVGKFNYWISYDHQESKGWYMSRDFESRETKFNNPARTLVTIGDGDVRDNSDYKMDGVWFKAGMEPAAGAEYSINAHYSNRERGAPPSLAENGNRISAYGTQLWRSPLYENWGVDLSGQQKVGERLTLKGKLFYHYHTDTLATYSLDSYMNEDWGMPINESNYKDNMYGAVLMSDVKLTDRDTLKFAVNYRRDTHDEQSKATVPYQTAESNTGSIGVENEYNPTKQLSLVAGIGYDWFEVTKSTISVTSGDVKTPSDSRVSPMAGVTYTLDDGTRIFASAAGKVRFPALLSLYSSSGGNPDLKPEKGRNYVVGVSRGITQYAMGEVTFFAYDIKDLISKVVPGTLSPYVNYGRVFIHGFEVTGEIYPLKDLTLNIGYTYAKAKDRSDGRITDDVTNVPEHKIDIGITYLIPVVNVKLGLTGLYVSRIWGQLPTSASPTTVPQRTSDYFIANAKISKTFFKNVEVYFGGKNILDRNYEQQFGFPAPGLNIYGGVKVTF